MNNPVQAAQNAALARQIAQVPPEVRAAIAKAGLQDAKAVLPVPYWSTVRFAATVAANTATILGNQQRKAFQYQIGQAPTVAGFATTDTAQPCDTNLLQAGQTLDNSDVWIYGLCLEICTNSEPLLAAEIWRQCLVELSLNGTTSIRLGTPAMFPSAGGLYGFGQSNLALPPAQVSGRGADGGPGAAVGFLANGNPMAGNFRRFPQPFKWSAIGSGNNDAQLAVLLTTNRDITVALAATRAAVAGGANTSGTGAWTQPATAGAGTIVDIRVSLMSVSVSRRSVNV